MDLTKNSGKIRILIVEDDVQERRNMLKFLSKDSTIEICTFFTSGFDIIEGIKFHKPDVFLTDFLATDSDGENVLSKINSVNMKSKPKVIVMSSSESTNVLEKSFSYGIDYYIKKPIIFSLLKDAIISVCQGKVASFAPELARVKNLVRNLGVPTNILGYAYIVEALNLMLCENRGVFLSETYRHIAQIHETSVECVEVSVRNAIKKAVRTAKPKLRQIFGENQNHISNSLFLTTLKEVLFEDISRQNF